MTKKSDHAYQTRLQGACDQISLNSASKSRNQPSKFKPVARSSSVSGVSSPISIKVSPEDYQLLKDSVFNRSGKVLRSPPPEREIIVRRNSYVEANSELEKSDQLDISNKNSPKPGSSKFNESSLNSTAIPINRDTALFTDDDPARNCDIANVATQTRIVHKEHCTQTADDQFTQSIHRLHSNMSQNGDNNDRQQNLTLRSLHDPNRKAATPKFISPSTYDHDLDNPCEFLRSYETSAARNNWDDNLKLSYFGGYLKRQYV